MADAWRPTSLILGAVCLWALSLLVLALAGLGSSFPAQDAQVAPPPIPKVSMTRSLSRLGPVSGYAEVGDRPLLNPDRRPSAALAVDGAAGAAELDVTLTSVMITPRLQLAILTDNKDGSSRRVRVGEMVAGSNWRLLQLQPRQAVIEGPSGQRTLELRVFDGKGSAPPRALASTAGPESGAGEKSEPPPMTPTASNSPPPPPPPTISIPNAAVAQQAAAQTQTAQDQQIEAIRRRIEARRAQMRAEAEAAGANVK